MGQECPDDPGILVRQCDRRNVLVTSHSDLEDPAPRIGFLSGSEDHRSGAMDQHRPQIRVTALAHAQQSRLAAAGVLPRYHAQSCGELSAVVEVPGITDGCYQCAGCDRTDTRHLLQSSTGFVCPMPCLDLFFDLVDLAAEESEVLE